MVPPVVPFIYYSDEKSSLMSKCRKLLEKAENSANNVRFDDLCKLAECYGWVLLRQEGSHQMFENGRLEIEQGRLQNFQNVGGKAKPYQVKQLLNAIELIVPTK